MNEGPSNNIASSTVDIEEWVNLLERKLRYYVSLRQTGRSLRQSPICKVPQKIFHLDKKAYEPISLSIGPYHHGNSALQVLEKKKWNYLNYILKLNPQKTLQDYLELIEGLKEQARNLYPNALVMESDEFIKMLLLDGCFLLVALYGIQETGLPVTDATELPSLSENKIDILEENGSRILGKEVLEEPNSLSTAKSALEVQLSQKQFIFSSRESSDLVQLTKDHKGCDNSGPIDKWLTAFLLHDLFLLENQIPFFVLEGIYELFSGECDSSKLVDRIVNMLAYIISYPIPLRASCKPNGFHHFLHFWHLYFSPTEESEEPQEYFRGSVLSASYFKRIYGKINIRHKSDKRNVRKKMPSLLQVNQLIRWRRAEQYHEAGVHFKKRVFSEHDQHSLLDIRFTHGLIEIPPLVIACHTNSFFKNIIALEQTCPQYGNYFTSYCVFLSQIVAKPDDVALLAKRGILVHHMRSDEEVSALLTKLGKNVDFDINGSHYLKSVCQRMEEHYQSRINRWMAWLWHNHFSNPWLGLAVLAAAIVLLCTILQTLFAFLAYFNPPEA